jgi:hypothetical protein
VWGRVATSSCARPSTRQDKPTFNAYDAAMVARGNMAVTLG